MAKTLVLLDLKILLIQKPQRLIASPCLMIYWSQFVFKNFIVSIETHIPVRKLIVIINYPT